jgi:hypothetical protein
MGFRLNAASWGIRSGMLGVCAGSAGFHPGQPGSMKKK